ncbi:hypothetical protein HYW55_04000 [Candidatus Gottesmanbacteria bacterium]|nr:hypothetical protein [Candidatus Gottesmanbacteria bacterium]
MAEGLSEGWAAKLVEEQKKRAEKSRAKMKKPQSQPTVWEGDMPIVYRPPGIGSPSSVPLGEKVEMHGRGTRWGTHPITGTMPLKGR